MNWRYLLYFCAFSRAHPHPLALFITRWFLLPTSISFHERRICLKWDWNRYESVERDIFTTQSENRPTFSFLCQYSRGHACLPPLLLLFILWFVIMSVMVVIFCVCCLNCSWTKKPTFKRTSMFTYLVFSLAISSSLFPCFCFVCVCKRLEMMRMRAHMAVINSLKYSAKFFFYLRESGETFLKYRSYQPDLPKLQNIKTGWKSWHYSVFTCVLVYFRFVLSFICYSFRQSVFVLVFKFSIGKGTVIETSFWLFSIESNLSIISFFLLPSQNLI